MGALASQFKTDSADPQKILRDLGARAEFGGVPVLILDIDKLRSWDGPVENYVMSRIEKAGIHAPALASAVEDFGSHFLRRLETDRKTELVSPYVWQNQKMMPCALVAPGKEMTPETLLRIGCGLTRNNPDSLMRDPQTFRIQVWCHELAHVAGAGEAQADRMASLLNRHLFPASPAPQIFADLRTIMAVYRGVNFFSSGKQSEQHRSLREYGWKTVQACDEMAALPQAQITRLAQQDVLASCCIPYDDSADLLIEFGREAMKHADLFLPDAHERPGKPRDIAYVAEGAKTVKEKIRASICDADMNTIAARFALAANRLAEGETAYRPYPSPVNSNLAPSPR